MKRIVVLGCPGSGKSTFARRLSERVGAPLISLDDIWRPEWTDADVPEFRTRVAGAHAGERWVSDGNFAHTTFDLRLPQADLIVWIDPPRPLCMWRALVRIFRPGEAHHALELPRVMWSIWRFDRVNRRHIEQGRCIHGREVPLVVLRRKKNVEAFLGAIVLSGET